MSEPTYPTTKIRRVTTACDSCRNKKVRCSGPITPHNRCAICVASDLDCTYRRVAKKRGPPSDLLRYVGGLEARMNQVEQLLRKHCPDVDVVQELRDIEPSPKNVPVQGELSTMFDSTNPQIIVQDVAKLDEDVDSSDHENAVVDITNRLTYTKLNGEQPSFYGRSSNVGLFRTIRHMKNEHSGIPDSALDDNFSYGYHFFGRNDRLSLELVQSLESSNAENARPNYQYPEPQSLSRLLDAYFEEFNLYMPIFHRPSFEEAITRGLHLREEGFGAVLLMVCAIAARVSKDPTINSGPDKSIMSSWFHQVQMHRRPLIGVISIYEVQLQLLTSLFLLNSCPPESAWLSVGIGIRLCQAIGAHRQKTYGAKPTHEGELWKRAFWCLLIMELWMSCTFGRQVSVREEDYDLEYPVECDDEYWSHPDPEKVFKQPPGKPSGLSYFISFIKLSHIHASILRKLYSSHKAKLAFNILDPEKEKIAIAGLDSALNDWFNNIPDHLKWDPDGVNPLFTKQSACLHIRYYHLRMLVHRPFITPPRMSSLLSSAFPSLAICATAARSASKIMDILHTRLGAMSCLLMTPLFTSGIVLIVNMWYSNDNGKSADQTEDLEALRKCMKIAKDSERIWFPAGLIWSVLDALVNAGKFHQPFYYIKRYMKGMAEQYSTSNLVPPPAPGMSVLQDEQTTKEGKSLPYQGSQFVNESPCPDGLPQYAVSTQQDVTLITSRSNVLCSLMKTLPVAPPSPPDTYAPNSSMFYADQGAYNEMISNLDYVLSASPQEYISRLVGRGLVSVQPATGTSQPNNSTIADPSYLGLQNLGDVSAANTAALMSSVPASTKTWNENGMSTWTN